jgi:hypothetical protein
MSKSDTKEIINSSSLVILPFEFIPSADQNDSGLNSNMNNCIDKIKTLSHISKNKLIDPSKYNNYISNCISEQPIENDSSFLKSFTIDIGKLKGLNTNNIEVKFATEFQNKSVLHIGDSSLQIKIDRINIVINEIAQLGYFIFKIDYIDTENNALNILAELDFYRFYQTDKIIKNNKDLDKRFAIKSHKKNSDKEGNDTSRTDYYSLIEIIETYFDFISNSVRFIHSKPIMLHLISDRMNLDSSDSDLANTCYKVLRIPSKNSSGVHVEQDNETVKMHSPDAHITFCTMSEGAIIIDTITGEKKGKINDLVNKYFPAFILALNQREVMLKTTNDISQISYKNLNSEDRKTLNKLGQLRKKLNLIQLKQIFYNISLYHEIELFFSELQSKFRIETLLNDNNVSIEAIHSLLESERIKNEAAENKLEEEVQKKRDNNLSLILSLVGLFGAISALIDIYNFFFNPDNFNYRWIPIFVFVFLGTYLFWFYKKK